MGEVEVEVEMALSCLWRRRDAWPGFRGAQPDRSDIVLDLDIEVTRWWRWVKWPGRSGCEAGATSIWMVL